MLQCNKIRIAWSLLAGIAAVGTALAVSAFGDHGWEYTGPPPGRETPHLIVHRPVDGGVVNVHTDSRFGLPPLPPNELERRKLDLARDAIAGADAAGTRWMVPADADPHVFDAGAEREKLERRWSMEPLPDVDTPGTPLESGGER